MKSLLYILIFHFSAISFAQDPEIFENTWYLQRIIIDGQDHLPPVNSEVDHVTLNIGMDFIVTIVCGSISGPILVIENDFFEVEEFIFISDNCFLPETIDFENIYFNDFFNFDIQNYTFDYIIETGSNDTKVLTLTNNIGNQAVYNNQYLSNANFHKGQFIIHPNPIKNELFIISNNIDGALTLKTFNIAGKLLKTQNVVFENQISIDVSQLSRGIYFLHIEDENGNKEVKKFVKE